MNTPIHERLKKIAPTVVFSTEWTPDRHFKWDGDGPDPIERGLIAFDVDVTATVIVNGEFKEGKASLGGTYEDPDKKDPDISGFLPQMLQESATELLKELINIPGSSVQATHLRDAIRYLLLELKARYEAQRKESKV